jgi:hypothetical protein
MANGKRSLWPERRPCPPKPLATAGSVTGFGHTLDNLCCGSVPLRSSRPVVRPKPTASRRSGASVTDERMGRAGNPTRFLPQSAPEEGGDFERSGIAWRCSTRTASPRSAAFTPLHLATTGWVRWVVSQPVIRAFLSNWRHLLGSYRRFPNLRYRRFPNRPAVQKSWRVRWANGPRVGKPAIPQTGKSAVHGDPPPPSDTLRVSHPRSGRIPPTNPHGD